MVRSFPASLITKLWGISWLSHGLPFGNIRLRCLCGNVKTYRKLVKPAIFSSNVVAAARWRENTKTHSRSTVILF